MSVAILLLIKNLKLKVMKHSLNEISTYAIKTIDEAEGNVKDILFDEVEWIVRYVETDFGIELSGTRKLIPRVFFKNPNWDEQHFPVKLTKFDLKDCPDIALHLPISRIYEQKVYEHFKEDEYWLQSYITPFGIPAITHPIPSMGVSERMIDERKLKTHLRSFQEIKGYEVHALDGNIGQINNIIIDDKDWSIRYAVIDTSSWLPWSKNVLIGVNWMDEISYTSKQIKINLDVETIKSAPEFDHSEPIDEKYEKMLNEHFDEQ